jgi:hypothetical protein
MQLFQWFWNHYKMLFLLLDRTWLKKINGLYCHFLQKKNWKTPFININDVDLNLECIFLLSTIRVLSIFSKLSVTTTLPELPVQYCLRNAATFPESLCRPLKDNSGYSVIPPAWLATHFRGVCAILLQLYSILRSV